MYIRVNCVFEYTFFSTPEYAKSLLGAENMGVDTDVDVQVRIKSYCWKEDNR